MTSEGPNSTANESEKELSAVLAKMQEQRTIAATLGVVKGSGLSREQFLNPKAQEVIKGIILQLPHSHGPYDSPPYLGMLLEVAAALPLSKETQQNPEVVWALGTQIVPSFYRSGETLTDEHIQSFQNLSERLNFDAAESGYWKKEILRALSASFHTSTADKKAAFAKFGYSEEETKEIVKEFISNSSRYIFASKLIEALNFSAEELAPAINLFLIRAFSEGAIAEALESVESIKPKLPEAVLIGALEQILDGEHAGQVIKHLDEIPERFISLLDPKYHLDDYKKRMNVPFVDMYDPAVYEKYVELTKTGSEADLEDFIKSQIPAGATAETLRMSAELHTRQNELGVSPDKYVEKVVEINQGREYERDLRTVNALFDEALGKLLNSENPLSIIEAVEQAVPEGKTIKILELGAGEGVALSELESSFMDDGRSVEVNAIEIDKERARILAEKGIHVVNELAESFIPTEKYNLIFDTYAAVSYTEQSFKKDLILKYCSALEKGGILLVAIDFLIDYSRHFGFYSDAMKKAHPNDQWVDLHPHFVQQTLSPHSPRKKVTTQKQTEEIVKALEKRGYKAVFTFTEPNEHFYRIQLAIQRM